MPLYRAAANMDHEWLKRPNPIQTDANTCITHLLVNFNPNNTLFSTLFRGQQFSMDTDPDGVTSYVYTALDHDSQSIRLIRLLPASSFESEIRCEIYNVSLDTNPEYEALSYAWGDPSVTERIFLEKCPFQATRNLVLALKYLRRTDTPRILWVDAISIDQSNIDERGHQVAFMSRIYAMASSDIFWLGDDHGGVARGAFEFVAEIAEIGRRLPDEGDMRDEAIRGASHALFDDEKKLETLSRVFQYRDVWTRIWIVQEIAVSKEVSIHCGDLSMSWELWSQFWGMVNKIPRLVPEGNSPMEEIWYRCTPAVVINIA